MPAIAPLGNCCVVCSAAPSEPGSVPIAEFPPAATACAAAPFWVPPALHTVPSLPLGATQTPTSVATRSTLPLPAPAGTFEFTSTIMSSPCFHSLMSAPSSVWSCLLLQQITSPACSAACSPTSNGSVPSITSSDISCVTPRHSVTRIGTLQITSAPPAPKRTTRPGRMDFSPQNKCVNFSARCRPHNNIRV